MRRSTAAEIVREYGPFPGADSVHGVTFDGQNVWFAAGDKLNAFDPASGKTLRSGLTWAEGTLWVGQYRDRKIHQVDPETGRLFARSSPTASSPGSPR